MKYIEKGYVVFYAGSSSNQVMEMNKYAKENKIINLHSISLDPTNDKSIDQAKIELEKFTKESHLNFIGIANTDQIIKMGLSNISLESLRN